MRQVKNHPPKLTRRLRLLTLLTIATVLGTSAFPLSGTATAASANPGPGSLRTLLPESVQKQGFIRVASLNDLPPWDYTVGSAFTGIDVDLTNAMAKLLGVSFQYENIAFTGEIPGLEAGRFDLIIDEIGDTAEREAVINFVDYSTDASAIIVKSGNPDHIATINDLCGKSVVAIPASVPYTQAQAQSAKCTAAGKPPITLITNTSPTGCYLAVASGRAAATLNGYSTAAFAIKRGGVTRGLELLDYLFGPGVNGFAFTKSNHQLGLAVQSALNAIMKNGQYATIMKSWGVSALSLPKATINGSAAYLAAHPSA
jgi:polar amino acid transport system substrate-binding protein